MSLHICPKCTHEAITWSLDEESSPYTQWRCGHCHYLAEENEQKESSCPCCASPSGCLLLRDSSGVHRWCVSCGRFDGTEELFT